MHDVTALLADCRITLAAWCRDCGAECKPPERERAKVEKSVDSDRGGTVIHLRAPGHCGKCSGGRIAVRLDWATSRVTG